MKADLEIPEQIHEELFTAEAILGMETRRGIVRLGYGITFDLQVSPFEARKIALSILEAADAAEGDEFLVTFLQKKVGVGLDGAVAVLRDFREMREAMRSRDSHNRDEYFGQ